jgi:ribosomal protein L37AE/L43A
MECPRCGEGPVSRYRLKSTGEGLLCCDECDATWPGDATLECFNFTQLGDLLASRGLSEGDLEAWVDSTAG